MKRLSDEGGHWWLSAGIPSLSSWKTGRIGPALDEASGVLGAGADLWVPTATQTCCPAAKGCADVAAARPQQTETATRAVSVAP